MSWHGPHRGLAAGVKKDIFVKLLSYAEDLEKKFCHWKQLRKSSKKDLAREQISQWVSKWDIPKYTPSKKRENCIDYFVLRCDKVPFDWWYTCTVDPSVCFCPQQQEGALDHDPLVLKKLWLFEDVKGNVSSNSSNSLGDEF
eukprot:m.167886 g.167886  ORF g.167886 m.167886 type:complete len:142 (+) comp38941_c0_seq30:1538-1963(+)